MKATPWGRSSCSEGRKAGPLRLREGRLGVDTEADADAEGGKSVDGPPAADVDKDPMAAEAEDLMVGRAMSSLMPSTVI